MLGGAGGGPTEHAKRGNTLSGHGQCAQRFAEKEDTSAAKEVFSFNFNIFAGQVLIFLRNEYNCIDQDNFGGY